MLVARWGSAGNILLPWNLELTARQFRPLEETMEANVWRLIGSDVKGQPRIPVEVE